MIFPYCRSNPHRIHHSFLRLTAPGAGCPLFFLQGDLHDIVPLTPLHGYLEFPPLCLPRIFPYHTPLPITCFPRPQVNFHRNTHPHTPRFPWTWAVQITCWIIRVSVSQVSSILCGEFPAACRIHFPPFSQNLKILNVSVLPVVPIQ